MFLDKPILETDFLSQPQPAYKTWRLDFGARMCDSRYRSPKRLLEILKRNLHSPPLPPKVLDAASLDQLPLPRLGMRAGSILWSVAVGAWDLLKLERAHVD